MRHGEEKAAELGLAHQRDGDSVGQHQEAVDDVLDQAVGQTADGDKKEELHLDTIETKNTDDAISGDIACSC